MKSLLVKPWFITFPLHPKFFNTCALLRFRVFCHCSSFVDKAMTETSSPVYFSEKLNSSFYFLWISLSEGGAKTGEQLKPLTTQVKTNFSVWVNLLLVLHLHPVIFLELGCYSTAVKCKTRWPTIRLFMYIQIVNKCIDIIITLYHESSWNIDLGL